MNEYANKPYGELCQLVYRHQGGSSIVGQECRKVLGLGEYETLPRHIVETAKAWVPAAAAVGVPDGLADVFAALFDGYAVYSALDEKAKTRTGAENVSDTLDAVVRLLRCQPVGGESDAR